MNYSFEDLTFYLIFILPGLISLKIFSMLIATVKKSVSELLFDGLFYACINIILLLPIYFILLNLESYLGIVVYVLIYVLMLVVSIGIPFLLNFLFTKTSIFDKYQLPFPTGWDYFFNQRETCFILFHLKNGKKIGGYYGKKSYSCSYPNHGDIYIQTVYEVKKDGTFGEYIKGSKGLWISKDNYDYIEMFSISKPNP